MAEPLVSSCLIADDNAFDLKAARRAVTKLWPDARIHEATNVEEAIKLLLEEKLDLALLDNDLSDGTSIQTIPEMLGLVSMSVPPLIMISGNADPCLPDAASKSGFAGFISKHGFDASQLSKIVSAKQPDGPA